MAVVAVALCEYFSPDKNVDTTDVLRLERLDKDVAILKATVPDA